MTKLEILKTEALKHNKSVGDKGYQAIDKLFDYAKMLLSETVERLIVSLFLWSMAGLMFYFGYKTGQDPTPIEVSGSGTDQSLSFKGALTFNVIGVILLLLPFFYMMVRKFKSREKIVYVKDN